MAPVSVSLDSRAVSARSMLTLPVDMVTKSETAMAQWPGDTYMPALVCDTGDTLIGVSSSPKHQGHP